MLLNIHFLRSFQCLGYKSDGWLMPIFRHTANECSCNLECWLMRTMRTYSSGLPWCPTRPGGAVFKTRLRLLASALPWFHEWDETPHISCIISFLLSIHSKVGSQKVEKGWVQPWPLRGASRITSRRQRPRQNRGPRRCQPQRRKKDRTKPASLFRSQVRFPSLTSLVKRLLAGFILPQSFSNYPRSYFLN